MSRLINVNYDPGIKFKISNHSLLKKNVNRGSYMSAHVLLNLLNDLGKR